MEVIENDVLPQALLMGVDYKDFWGLSPKDLRHYSKAFSLKQDLLDQQAWIQGQYIQIAIASCLDSKCKYPSQPFTKQSKNVSDNPVKDKFMRRMAEINARFEGGE